MRSFILLAALFISSLFGLDVGPRSYTSSHQYLKHALSTHEVDEVYFLGGRVRLEDESVWIIAYSDRFNVTGWQYADRIFITQSESPLSGYHFILFNETLNVYALANRYEPPCSYNRYTRWIQQIDYRHGSILLNDNHWYLINKEDLLVMSDWREGDLIIMGSNSTACFQTYPFLLINASLEGQGEWITARGIY